MFSPSRACLDTSRGGYFSESGRPRRLSGDYFRTGRHSAHGPDTPLRHLGTLFPAWALPSLWNGGHEKATSYEGLSIKPVELASRRVLARASGGGFRPRWRPSFAYERVRPKRRSPYDSESGAGHLVGA